MYRYVINTYNEYRNRYIYIEYIYLHIYKGEHSLGTSHTNRTKWYDSFLLCLVVMSTSLCSKEYKLGLEKNSTVWKKSQLKAFLSNFFRWNQVKWTANISPWAAYRIQCNLRKQVVSISIQLHREKRRATDEIQQPCLYLCVAQHLTHGIQAWFGI